MVQHSNNVTHAKLLPQYKASCSDAIHSVKTNNSKKDCYHKTMAYSSKTTFSIPRNVSDIMVYLGYFNEL